MNSGNPGSQESPSAQALAQVGQHIRYAQSKQRKKVLEGICIGVRRTGTVVRTSDGSFPGVQWLIETKDGKKIWTEAFADREMGPLGHPLWGACDCADEDEHHRRVLEEAPMRNEVAL